MSTKDKVTVKFKGNIQDYIFNEVYELSREDASVYIVLGYAEEVKKDEEIK